LETESSHTDEGVDHIMCMYIVLNLTQPPDASDLVFFRASLDAHFPVYNFTKVCAVGIIDKVARAMGATVGWLSHSMTGRKARSANHCNGQVQNFGTVGSRRHAFKGVVIVHPNSGLTERGLDDVTSRMAGIIRNTGRVRDQRDLSL